MADAETPPVSTAYVEAVGAIARKVGVTPLPKGINQAENDDWRLTLNASPERVQHDGTDLLPWHILAEHKVYFVICLFGPFDGMIGGGMPEDEFIEQMKAFGAPTGQPS